MWENKKVWVEKRDVVNRNEKYAKKMITDGVREKGKEREKILR